MWTTQKNVKMSNDKCQARGWLCFTYDKSFKRVGYPPPVLVIPKDEVVILLHITEDQQLNDLLHITQLKSVAVSPFL